MKFIQGHNRTQINLFPASLDQSIDPGNEVTDFDKGYHTGSKLITARSQGTRSKNAKIFSRSTFTEYYRF
jgi:hypothetical protein